MAKSNQCLTSSEEWSCLSALSFSYSRSSVLSSAFLRASLSFFVSFSTCLCPWWKQQHTKPERWTLLMYVCRCVTHSVLYLSEGLVFCSGQSSAERVWWCGWTSSLQVRPHLQNVQLKLQNSLFTWSESTYQIKTEMKKCVCFAFFKCYG